MPQRSFLFIPGNSPRMLTNAGILGADVVIFDLEDAVSLSQKDAARIMLKNYLGTGFCGGSYAVRVNDIATPFFSKDIEAVVQAGASEILLPKVSSAKDIAYVDDMLSKEEARNRLAPGSVGIYAILETALGIENAFEIATAAKRVKLLSFGGEDYAADLGAKRTKENTEIDYARKRCVNVAKAAGRMVVDTVFTDVNDMQGLEQDTRYARLIGFDGKCAISPRQIQTINEIFSPTQEEINYATRVVKAMEEADRKNQGAVSLDGKMLDAPVLARAKRVLGDAKLAGKLS